MKAQRKTKKEWLDSRGRMLPIEQLRESSKSWDQKKWEQFLDSTDGSIEGLQLMSGRKLTYKTEYMTSTIFDLWAEKNGSEKIKEIIRHGLASLTERQKQIVKAVYYEGLSIEGAAAKFGLSKSTAFVHLQKALLNLKQHITVRPNDLTEVRGQEDFSGDTPEGIDPEIYEVYLSETQRYGLNSSDFDCEGL